MKNSAIYIVTLIISLLFVSCTRNDVSFVPGDIRPVFIINDTKAELIEDFSAIDEIYVQYCKQGEVISETLSKANDGMFYSSLILDLDSYSYGIRISNYPFAKLENGEYGIAWSSSGKDLLFCSDDELFSGLSAANNTYYINFEHLATCVDGVRFVIPSGSTLVSGSFKLKSAAVSATYKIGSGWYMSSATKEDRSLVVPVSGITSFNNLLLVPGTYDVDVEYTLSSSVGNSDFSSSKSFTLAAGKKYVFKVNLKSDDLPGEIGMDIGVWEPGNEYDEGM